MQWFFYDVQSSNEEALLTLPIAYASNRYCSTLGEQMDDYISTSTVNATWVYLKSVAQIGIYFRHSVRVKQDHFSVLCIGT